QEHVKVASRHIATERGKIFDQYDKTGPLTDARQEAERLESELNSLSKPILARLKTDSKYRELSKKYGAADRLVNEDAETSKERGAALQDMINIKKEMKDMENTMIHADPEAHSLSIRLGTSRDNLKDLVNDRDQRIAQDPSLAGAYADLKKAKSDLEKAEGD